MVLQIEFSRFNNTDGLLFRRWYQRLISIGNLVGELLTHRQNIPSVNPSVIFNVCESVGKSIGES